MRKVSLAGAAAVISMAAISAPAQDAVPGPDIHFKGPNGGIERGVRCAAEKVTPEVQAEVDRVLADARGSGRMTAGGGITIPVVFHVLHNGSEGNIPDSMIEAQVDVLNDAFRSRGFAFTLASINRVQDRKWFTNCYGNQNFKRDLAVDLPTR